MKYNATSPNTSFMDHGMQLTEITRPLKFLSNSDQISQKDIDQKFFIRYYMLLLIAFSNNLLYFCLNSEASVFLLVSIGLVLFLFMFSLLVNIFRQSIEVSLLKTIFNCPVLLSLTGICLLFIDPDIMKYLTHEHYNSYLSSLQTLLLLAALGFKYSQYSLKFPIYVILLGVISLGLTFLHTENRERNIYEFSILLVFVFSGSIYVKYSYIKPEKVDTEGEKNTGVEEIANTLDKILENIIEINENHDSKKTLSDVITQLKQVNNKIRTCPNIYSAQLNAVTKDMDEQDKKFIEQACFDSYTVSNAQSPRPLFPFTKDHDVNYGVSELMGVLKNVGREWNFNTFFIADCSGSTPIQVIGSYAIKRFGLDDIFSISAKVLKSFLRDLEERYEKNPYHNSCHAADVMCSLTFIVHISMLMEYVSSSELLAGLIASLAHDVGHPGKNNRFMVMSHSDTAIIYNDISVLEMMHSSILFQILKVPENNILAMLTNDKWALMRKDIIDMILATDMGKHFELLGQFRTKYLNNDLHDLTESDVRSDIFKLIIKAADIGHAAKNIELHEVWCGLVIQEFYEQGDLEKSLGIPISMYCDRDTTDISKSQSGFIKNIVYPLFVSLNSVLSSQQIEEKCIQQLITNQKYWENKRKFCRGQSLLVRPIDVARKSTFLPKIKTRKSSLPGKPLV